MIDSIIESDEELKENYAIITSIKGIARQNATCMIIYTNNFRKFDCDPRKTACYLWLLLHSENSLAQA
jgi:hypothetical protein